MVRLVARGSAQMYAIDTKDQKHARGIAENEVSISLDNFF